MENQTQWQELLKRQPLGMGSFDLNDDKQENQSANNRSDERKKKSKLRLGLIKG